MKIKLVAISLAVVLVFSCFAGCGKNDEISQTNTNQSGIQNIVNTNLPDGISDGYYNGKNYQFKTIDGWETNALSEDVFMMNTPENSKIQAMINVATSESGGTKTTDLTWEMFSSEMKATGFEVEKYQFGLTKVNGKDCLVNEYSMTSEGQTYYVKAYFFDVDDNVVAIQMNVSEKGGYYNEFDEVVQSFVFK